MTGCNCKVVYTDVVWSREASVHVDADEPHCVLTEGGIAPTPQKEAHHQAVPGRHKSNLNFTATTNIGRVKM